ncbi:hypothetical protein [Kocuria massiliensis]|uniref:hypothetical protein n=1 Tax=Kocuria massiliensis TaxID=1926282 RepID=UPI000A1CE8C4|nr:hypothetical protein [Kocuria massiliensis]
MGTLAEWAAALVAVVAIFFAWKSNQASTEMLSMEQRRDEENERRKKMDQASNISAWCTFLPDHQGPRKDALQILNNSQLPAYQVDIHSTNKDGNANKPLHLEVLPPGNFIALSNEKFGWDFPEARETFTGTIRPITKSTTWCVENIELTDSFGNRWERDRRGQHTLISSAPEPH